jgi:hypothetical protein
VPHERTGNEPDFITAIVRDLAASLAIPEDEITVARIERVTWRDGSLGCPEPGMLYSQMLVDGFHVILGAGGATHDYRVGRGGAFRRCLEPPDEALLQAWEDSRR